MFDLLARKTRSSTGKGGRGVGHRNSAKAHVRTCKGAGTSGWRTEWGGGAGGGGWEQVLDPTKF